MSELTEYFLRHYTLVLDNDQGTHEAVRKVVRDFFREEEVPLAEYLGMSVRERADRFASELGERILNLISEWIEEWVPDRRAGVGAELIHECMFLAGGSQELEWALGDHYLPEDVDADNFMDDEDEEDGE